MPADGARHAAALSEPSPLEPDASSAALLGDEGTKDRALADVGHIGDVNPWRDSRRRIVGQLIQNAPHRRPVDAGPSEGAVRRGPGGSQVDLVQRVDEGALESAAIASPVGHVCGQQSLPVTPPKSCISL